MSLIRHTVCLFDATPLTTPCRELTSYCAPAKYLTYAKTQKAKRAFNVAFSLTPSAAVERNRRR